MSSDHQLIKAVQSATKRLASSANFDAVLQDVLHICVDAVGAEGGTIYVHEPEHRRLRFEHVIPDSVLPLLPALAIPDDFGFAGDAFQRRKTVHEVLPKRTRAEETPFEHATGVVIRSMIATPLMLESEEPIGVVQLLNKRAGDFDDTDARVLETIASVSTMAYVNFRLSEEASRASHLLGMGKVSHDIGNLAAALHANVAYASLAVERLRAEPLGDGATELLSDLGPSVAELRGSVDRIAAYARLVSDMSAGRELRPSRAPGSLGATVRDAASYLEPQCRAAGIELCYDIQVGAPPFAHDEQYVFRIVQNLVGNAVKGVCEHADPTAPRRIRVGYHALPGEHVVEVADTGAGMSPELVRQIISGGARSYWKRGSGSGWGTKIVMELAAAHGGAVEVESQIGEGACFRLRFPVGEGETAETGDRFGRMQQ